MDARFLPAALVSPVLVALLLAAQGCSSKDASPAQPVESDAGVDDADTHDAEPDAPSPSDPCTALGLPIRAFDDGAGGVLRHELAADFTVPTLDEGGVAGSWSFKERWSGCESYVFVPDTLARSQKDATSIWERDVDKLIAASPKNAHYFFVSRKVAAEASTTAMRARIDAALAALPEADAAHWRERLHVVSVSAAGLEGWLKSVLGGVGTQGFAIDRFQRIRGVGSLADVARFKPALQSAGAWPWESNLAYAAHEVRLFEFEAKREIELAKHPATVVKLWDGEVLEEFAEKEVTLPSASEMAGFDTLEIDVDSRCPDPKKPELGNCGAWDYLAHFQVFDDEGERVELARFITSYHRETRWVVDASPMLALLKAGGARKFRYDFAPEWNKQPTETRVSLRFSNRGKALKPASATFLWSGGTFDSKYDEAHAPLDVPIPATAKKVELVAIITGHGAEANQCAEFCNHQHEVTVNGAAFLREFPEAKNNKACIDQVDHGMVPNQGGTWWFGRGGWCPGQYVAPWAVDVTSKVKPGETANLSYRGLYDGKTPPDGSGNVVVSSWLVTYE